MLLANAANVEQRVVNADGESDQENDVLDRVVDRSDLTQRSDESERRHDGTDRQQERDPCGQQRAEGDEQDDEGQGQRAELGFVEIGLDDLVKPLLRADIAELLDAQARVGCGCGIDSRDVASTVLAAAGSFAAPRTSKATSAVWPSREIRPPPPYGVCSPVTPLVLARLATTSSTAARNAGAPALQVGALDEHRLVDPLRIGVVDDLGGLA